MRDDSVDFPNPILTCLEYVGLLASLSFVWIRDKWPFKSVLSFKGVAECWHARCSNHFTRETRDKSHQGGAVARSVYQEKLVTIWNLHTVCLLPIGPRGSQPGWGRGPPPESFWPGLWGFEGSTGLSTANVSAALCSMQFMKAWSGGTWC